MGITLNTILHFAGKDRVLLNAQGTGLESVNRLQRFKSFFNIGNARQKNAETLMAIHHAVLNDPRFATKDLQDQAVRLLSEVRVDRALDATRIRKIAEDLDGLAAKNNTAYNKRAELCLAATPLRGCLQDYASEVLEVVQYHVRDAASAAGANAGPLDVARLVGEAVAACENAVLSVGVNGQRPDPYLMRMVGRNLRAFIVRGDNTLRPMAEITARVRQSSDFFRCVQAYARQRFEGRVFSTGAEADAASAARAKFELAALDFLGEAQRPMPPEAFDLIQNFVARVPLYDLPRLDGRSSADEIFDVLHTFATFMHERQVLKADGSPLIVSDPTASTALETYLARLVVMKLPEDVRRGLFEALDSPAGARALARIDHDAATTSAALGDYVTVRTFIECLEPTVGREGWYVNKFDKPAQGRGVRRPSLDLTGFSTAARTVYDPQASFTGRATSRLRTAILDPLAAAMEFGRRPDPAGAFRKRIAGGVRTVLDGVFADTMRSLATGDRAVALAANVTLPGGDALEADPAAARDRLARLATGRDDAVYANLSAADRARADVLLVLLSSDVGEVVEKGISAALAVDRDHEMFRVNGGDVAHRFVVTGSAAEGFHIRCEVHRTPQSVTLVPSGSAVHETIAAGDGSFIDAQLDLFFTPDDLTRLADRDWSAYDPAAFNSAFVGDTLSLAALDGTVQQDFRLGGDMAAVFQMNLNPAVAGT